MFSHVSRTGFGVLLLSLVVSGAAWADPWLIAQSTGPVWYGANAAQLVSLGSNADIPGGATLVTGEDGRAMLVRGAQTMMVGPNSVVIVPDEDKAGITTILQRAGVVTFDVDHQNAPHFAVETPYLAAVVKGTHFTVSIEYGKADVAVERGLVGVVDLVTGESVDTAAGQQATVSGSGAGLAIFGSGSLAAMTQSAPRAPLVAPLSVDDLRSLQDKARNGAGSGLREVRAEGGVAVVAGNFGGGNGGNGGGTDGDTGGSSNGAGGGTISLADGGSAVEASGSTTFAAASGGVALRTALPYGGSMMLSRPAPRAESISPLMFALGAALLALLALGLAYIRGMAR